MTAELRTRSGNKLFYGIGKTANQYTGSKIAMQGLHEKLDAGGKYINTDLVYQFTGQELDETGVLIPHKNIAGLRKKNA